MPTANTLVLVGVLVLLPATALGAEKEVIFRDVQLPGANKKLINASLSFSDTAQIVSVHVADGRVIDVPYGQIDKFSYEYTKKHRIKQGIILAVISPWSAGSVVAFTKSKSHWLDISFQQESVAKLLVLRLDKSDYQMVCDTAKARTGKELEILGETKQKAMRDKISN
jgi:hypothetical protein